MDRSAVSETVDASSSLARRTIFIKVFMRIWCREKCINGHQWVWLFEEGMLLGKTWPCGCDIKESTIVLEEWPEGCLKIKDK